MDYGVTASFGQKLPSGAKSAIKLRMTFPAAPSNWEQSSNSGAHAVMTANSRFPQYRKLIGKAVGALALAALSYYLYWEYGLHRFTAVTEHQLYQSAEMPPDELIRVANRHGIRAIIDLRTSEESPDDVAAERAALEGSGIQYVHLPVQDVPNNETVMSFLEIVGDPSKRPVLIHCKHGVGRSVLFASIFRVEFENWDNETARRAVEPLHWRGNFAPHSPKGKYLLDYKAHVPVLTFASDSGAAIFESE